MTHGNSIGASTETLPSAAALQSGARGRGGYEAWRQLDADRRLQLIEQTLRATDGLVDEFSLAL